MCSTFKLFASALVLARVDRHEERLARRVVFSARDLASYSPVTGKHVGGSGMAVAELCEAAITLSDNTAGNLLLASFGGPKAFTAYARALGDMQTRLDRTEPTLNEALPGDPRDTTTPAAMLGNLQKLLVGDALSPSSRAQLLRWLEANKTGDARLRAHLPAGWKVGDKTGTGDRGATSDIGILLPPGRAPILITVYLTETKATAAACSATIASVGAAIAGWV
jgi:beta-lactamase class A